ncbi:hypothetical protein ABK905_25790 [Acerihabitans sp. KWT182]|uniref:LysM domain-containing protein n=1 Tax=Acerihabitans sp. KWT182 TaxID=3157919 RepID=A0AAU7Q9T2_9GAMM
MEGIDYKEIAENNPHITPHNWAIIKQIAAADEPFHPLEQGQTTQPVPMPVSNKEFSPSAFVKPAAPQALRGGGNAAAPAPQASAFASPLMAAVSKVLATGNGAGTHANDPPTAGTSPINDNGYGQPASRLSILDSVGRGLPPPLKRLISTAFPAANPPPLRRPWLRQTGVNAPPPTRLFSTALPAANPAPTAATIV